MYNCTWLSKCLLFYMWLTNYPGYCPLLASVFIESNTTRAITEVRLLQANHFLLLHPCLRRRDHQASVSYYFPDSSTYYLPGSCLFFSSSGGTLIARVKFVSRQSCSHFSLQQLIFVGKRDYSLDVGHLFKNLRIGLFILKPSFKSRRFKERMTLSDSHDFLPLYRNPQHFLKSCWY